MCGSCNQKPIKSEGLVADTLPQASQMEDSLVEQEETYIQEDMDFLDYVYKPSSIPAESGIVLLPKGNYDSLKSAIEKERRRFYEQLEIISNNADSLTVIDSATNYLEKMVLNSLLPHWYGTRWTYEGHTNVPQEGSVACGYLVSTVLKHAAFNLNRYRVAQQYSIDIAKILQGDTSLIMLEDVSLKYFVEKVKDEFEEGLYVVGLSNHVGFLLKRASEVYFIHSSYVDPVKVIIENANGSFALSSSSFYAIGKLTTSRKVIEKWIRGEEFEIM